MTLNTIHTYIMLREEEIDQLIYSILLTRMDKKQKIQNLVDQNTIYKLISTATTIFDLEPILYRIEVPIHICGDIHGNIDDLIRIFERCGYPPDCKYLFLGDYVDRGPASIEVMLLLLCLKIKYPEFIYMLRGNHETQLVAKTYGFNGECVEKYGSEYIYYLFMDLFKEFPIAAVVNDLVFCVHGGISPSLKYIEEFETIEKPKDVRCGTMVSDLLWSDPISSAKYYDKKNIDENQKNDTLEPTKENDDDDKDEQQQKKKKSGSSSHDLDGFKPNSRGCGYYFGYNVLIEFLENNDFQMIIRSHEEKGTGFEWAFAESNNCLTVFSSSDYCGHRNLGCCVAITEALDMQRNLFFPLEEEELAKRRIILPYWLLNKVDSFESILQPEDISSGMFDCSDAIELIVNIE